MNESYNISLGGIAFVIDSNAYVALKNYLEDVDSRLGIDSEGRETLADIESRIAEIFSDFTGGNSNIVINLGMVESAMAQIGTASEFGEPRKTQSPPVFATVTKKLFRDPDDKFLGGVCSGIASYFNLDTSLVRVLTIILAFFAGASIWVYIILWIIIPQASTPTEKEMVRNGHNKK